MINELLRQECDLKFFFTNGYTRKKCESCGAYFWTQDPKATLCGDRPCVPFSFLEQSPAKKPLSLSEVRNKFISYFEHNQHKQVSYPETGHRCPVIARWRTDIYLTIASIADFQPHVTSGTVPPPANPLVISQPCIRLNDLDEVGKSGRHLTMFEMMGHHAFNKDKDEIYWKEETVAYCDEFFRKEIGIPQEAITYKEHLWIGGGNAGPCIEVLAGGLEIATLVFMNLMQQQKGTINLEDLPYTENPLNIVDTGYGLERIAWFTQSTPTVYETVFPSILNAIKTQTAKNAAPADIYSLADHTKCLAFMLGDGIVPSNVKAGYLCRLIIRRALRFLEKLTLRFTLADLVDLQLKTLKKDFPELSSHQKQIDEILTIETQRFKETLTKGRDLVTRIIEKNKKINTEQLIELYDSYGMPPDIVHTIAKDHQVTVHIPTHFDSMIAERHSHEQPQEHKTDSYPKHLPETKPLYYSNHYQKEFTATVLWTQPAHKGTHIILDQTTFYPEGGGQPGDKGTLQHNGTKISVLCVEKHQNAIIHHIQGTLKKGDKVHGEINWNHRYTLMKHHTGTHVVNGALRKILGEHIWQAGSQLRTNEARFDFSHYKPITEQQRKKIEHHANHFIKQKIPVEKQVMQRNKAEKRFGFRLYQGGVPPGNTIRILNIPEIDVEACGGTHLDNIGEIEKIKIIKTERIQDGVNRIIFAAGKMVDAFQEEEHKRYQTLTGILEKYYTIQNKKNISDQLTQSAAVLSVPIDQLEKTVKRFLKEISKKKQKTVNDLPEACTDLFETWKQTQKQKKKIDEEELQRLENNAEHVPDTQIRIITGQTHSDATATAGALIKQKNVITHISDGNKITSAASENVDIDLRKIAPEIGKILGGSGGGKPKLTQSGGPNKTQVDEALRVAKQLTLQQMKKKKK